MYCGFIGVEFEHFSGEKKRLWCYENYEREMLNEVSVEERDRGVEILIRTELTQKFLQEKSLIN